MGNNPLTLIDSDGGYAEPPEEAGSAIGQQYFDSDTGETYAWDGNIWESNLGNVVDPLDELVITSKNNLDISSTSFIPPLLGTVGGLLNENIDDIIANRPDSADL